MAKVEQGAKVKVHYTGTTEEGKFDSSKDRNEPLEFVVGEGKLITGFENAVEGMEVGETVTVDIPFNEAYGPRNESMIQIIDKKNLPDGAQVGAQLQGQGPQGEPVLAQIMEIKEDKATLDFNHPLAGKDLKFEIELLEVVEEE